MGIQYIWLLLLLIILGTEIVLHYLDIMHIRKHRSQLSDDTSMLLQKIYSHDKYQKAASYTVSKHFFNIHVSIIHTFLIALLVLSGLAGHLDKVIVSGRGLGWQLLFLLIITSSLALINIPKDLYRDFKLEKKFGFNKTTPKTWISDRVKSLIIALVLNTIIFAALLVFLHYTGNHWWIYGFLLLNIFQILMLFAWPLLIAPLFNKFVRLEDPSLRQAIDNLTQKANFPVKDIYLMDGSKRSSHSNAYFTGVGSSRRIVIYDTLFEQLQPNELLAVIAHEIGHYKKHHLPKILSLLLIVSFLAFLLLGFLKDIETLYLSFGFHEISAQAFITLIILVFSHFMFFLTPLFSWFSRKGEYQADNLAVELINNSSDLENALIKLTSENLGNIYPHPVYSFFYNSHPAITERIANIRAKD